MRIAPKIVIFFLIILLTAYSVSGAVSNLTVIPENPFVGDELIMKGKADPGDLYPSITFTKQIVHTSDKRFFFQINNIYIPPENDGFSITAIGVDDLNLSITCIVLNIETKCKEISKKAVNNVVKITHGHVYAIRYFTISMNGNSNTTSTVNLTIKVTSKITADSNGYFESRYSTSQLSPGTYIINIGGKTQTIFLSDTVPPSPEGDGISEATGGGGVTSSEPSDNIKKSDVSMIDHIANIPGKHVFKSSELNIYEIISTTSDDEKSVSMKVELLKSPSKLVTATAPSIIYNNLNIWTSTKKIINAVIRFKVENFWITSNNLMNNEVKLLRWDGTKWVGLDTAKISEDPVYSYFEAETDTFLPFAITGLKPEPDKAPIPEVTKMPQTPTIAIEKSIETRPPTNWALIIGVFLVIGIIVLYYLKRKS